MSRLRWALAAVLAAAAPLGGTSAAEAAPGPGVPPSGLRAVRTMAALPQTPAKIMMVGDSITAGSTNGTESTPGPVPRLAERLTAAGIPHTIVNVAVPGSKAEHWVDAPRPTGIGPPANVPRKAAPPVRPCSGGDRLSVALREHAPNVVLLELGTNERPEATPLAVLRATYAALVKTVNGCGARLVLARTIQISIEDGTGVQDRERFINDNVLAWIASTYGTSGPDFAALGQTGLSADRIHPSWPDGYRVRGDLWYEAYAAASATW